MSSKKNMLTVIPDNFGSLSRLIHLDLHQNSENFFDSTMNKGLLFPHGYSHPFLENTFELNNSLSTLLAEIGELCHLATLDLHSNQLKEFPKEACKLRLSLLDLSNNSLSGLPSEIGLGLNAVPSEVWESVEVVKVDLSRNSVQELSVELSSCISLQSLILSRNKIQEWPGAILKSLANLSCLKLDYNPLRQIPSNGFQAVSMLQILDLSGNPASLPENPAFSSLPHLQELYLRHVRLQEVPFDILNLQQLRILDLRQNILQSIRGKYHELSTFNKFLLHMLAIELSEIEWRKFSS
ncbi:hypothetical protein GH714_043072 [Hevea brasiliensis]|uniref:Uncharacterized protein n=1 Tax=Hevea brasiliensis TaxID=3981 RepID=A0A6A6K430_HEVBR|nr:hypothetical protein GH714_043072 [Hevea brasiliensis]